MLHPVTHPARRPSKGPRELVATSVAPEVTEQVDAARERDDALAPAVPLRERVTRNNWITAAVLAALQNGVDLRPYIRGAHAGGDLLAVRLQPTVTSSIDGRCSRLRHGSKPLSRALWVAAAVRWALEQPPGVVADQIVHVPRRVKPANGQGVLEVFTQQAV
jgi:hypothetical protein